MVMNAIIILLGKSGSSLPKTATFLYDKLTFALYSHEVGHAFGLPHSSGMYGATYDSQWDVMSGGGCGCNPLPPYRNPAAHTIGFHKDVCGWANVAQVPDTAVNEVVVVERLAQPIGTGPVTVKIPVVGTGSDFYYADCRLKAGWDDNVPLEGVNIHRVDTTRKRSAQVVDDTLNNDPNDGGAQWLPGERFMAPAADGALEIGVCSITNNRCTIVINPTNTPPAAVCQDVVRCADSSGQYKVTLGDIDGGSFDTDCMDTNPTIEIMGSTTLSVGSHSVVLRITDSVGLSDTCTANVQVLDYSDPQCDTTHGTKYVVAITNIGGVVDDDAVAQIDFDDLSGTAWCNENGCVSGESLIKATAPKNGRLKIEAFPSAVLRGSFYTIAIMCKKRRDYLVESPPCRVTREVNRAGLDVLVTATVFPGQGPTVLCTIVGPSFPTGQIDIEAFCD